MVNVLYLSIPGIGVSDMRGKSDCHCATNFSDCLEISALESEPRWGGRELTSREIL